MQNVHPAASLRRRLLGAVSLLLIGLGAVGVYYGGGSDSQTGLLASACLRAGCVLGAVWLAFPQIAEVATRLAPWLVGALLLAGLAVAIRPKSIAFVGPLLLVLFVMHFLRRR